MADTRGLVIGVSDNGSARVLTERNSACGGCAETSKCRTCLGGSKMEGVVFNKAGAHTGDIVSIHMDYKDVWKGAALLYLIPVIGLIAGAVMSPWMSSLMGLSETGGAILLGFSGLIAGFAIVKLAVGRLTADHKMTPFIERVIHANSSRISSPAENSCPSCK